MLLKFLACGTGLNPNYAEAGKVSQAAFSRASNQHLFTGRLIELSCREVLHELGSVKHLL